MESYILPFIKAITNGEIKPEIGLLLAIISIMYMLYKKVFLKILEKIDDIPSKSDLKRAMKDQTRYEYETIKELYDKLNKLSKELDEIDEISKDSKRELSEIRKDIEEVKTILNQFQGHMMYGPKSFINDFGNRELK